MRVQAHNVAAASAAERSRRSPVEEETRHADLSGQRTPLSPEALSHFQRTAGNTAVAALVLGHKHAGEVAAQRQSEPAGSAPGSLSSLLPSLNLPVASSEI